MDLYNCETEREKELKEIELTGLDDYELEKLADEIYEEFREGALEDEVIVTDALYKIVHEVLRRLATKKAVLNRVIDIGLDIDGDKNA